MPEFVQPFLGYFSAHPYLIIFVSLLFVGELVLLPAIYLAITGRLDLGYVIFVAVTSTLLSDFGWYYAGRKFPAAALQRLPGRHTGRWVNRLDALFDRRGAQMLFLSKFVYGTRVVAQVLAGLHDMPLRLYLIVNTLGVTALTLVLSGIAWAITGTARHFADFVQSVEIAFFAFIVVAAMGYASAAVVARRRWSQ